MYCAIILGADKTTVSVATGHVEYHPLYLTIGNLRNAARRGHHNGVIPIGFLAIPKGGRQYDDSNKFRIFKKQLYHESIAAILRPLKDAMEKPVIKMCPDGYYRRVIYDLGAFIADYPEQVLLLGIVQGWCFRCTARGDNLDGPGGPRTRKWVCTVLQEYGGDGTVLWDNFGIDDDVLPFTHQFPQADIHEMLTPDILHQIVKGCFKDMLVEWIWDYLAETEDKQRVKEIMDEIDRRLSLTPAFPGLRHFPEGRRFKQWTGDDSKALMKILLPAVEPFVPPELTACLGAFLDFCYLVRQNEFTEDTMTKIQAAIDRFHFLRQIFVTHNVHKHFSILRMHAMSHYPALILEFGAPNGVCSSITESRHITAVKKPWRRSSRFNALSQMLLTNQRQDKMAAKRMELVARGLLPPAWRAVDRFEEGKEDEGGIDDIRMLGVVDLAKKRGTMTILLQVTDQGLTKIFV
ncbi:hypothetical protein VNI00_000077 [Paramarasmius palmivorus]|uniref:Uncharacterized protein n=1 Tax=Paramarasmius palmivorus TaxID=297713 RepID=A0AAW0EEN8_9AGAR